jgi:hypothetical protein
MSEISFPEEESSSADMADLRITAWHQIILIQYQISDKKTP